MSDEIERLRKRNNYLRQELSATDYRKREQAEEIERLRAELGLRIAQVETLESQMMDRHGEFMRLRLLTIAWADAKDAMRQAPPSDLTHDLKAAEAEDGLRKAVGR